MPSMAAMNHPDLRNNMATKLPMVFAGKLLPVLFLLIITVMYSRNLGYEDYGKYQTMWVLNSISGTVLLFGLPSMMLSWGNQNFLAQVRNNWSKIAVPGLLLV